MAGVFWKRVALKIYLKMQKMRGQKASSQRFYKNIRLNLSGTKVYANILTTLILIFGFTPGKKVKIL
jgi:hypothetical protein